MTKLRELFLAALTLTLPALAAAQTPAAPATPEATPPAAKPAPPPPPAVQVYGTINVNLHYADMADATPPGVNSAARFVVSADSSNVGVRGTLKLTEGYSAVYQCETGANVEGEGVVGLCNRNSRVGLSGFWGTLAYGNWDTPMKAQHYGTKADDPFGNTDVYGFQGIMGSPGFQVKTGSFGVTAPGATPVSVGGFDLRGGNSVLYFSPKVMGASLRLQYGADEFRSPDGLVDPMLLGAGVTYEAGIFSVVGAFEYHEDSYGLRTINPGTAAAPGNTGLSSSKDWAWRLAAGVDLPLAIGALNVMGMFEQLNYGQDGATNAAALEDYSRMAWLLGAKLRMGSHEFRARYSQALAPDITAVGGVDAPSSIEDDFAAQQWALGYAYFLAKSTQVYVSATQIMNDDAARYTFGVAGSAILTTSVTGVTNSGTPAGADLTAIGIGMRHAF